MPHAAEQTTDDAGRAPARPVAGLRRVLAGEPRSRRSPAPAQEPITTGMTLPRPGIRRLGRTVALGGGGLTLLGVTGVGVLLAEARLASRWIVARMSTPFDVDGRYDAYGRVDASRPVDRPLRLLVMGDSAAAGLGADEPAATPGVLLATGVARATGHLVDLRTQTRVGAVSAELAGQVDAVEAEGLHPDVVLVIIGGNDVKTRVPAATAARQLGEAVTRLRALGALVVVGTVPDLGTITSVQQPLRALGGRWSRQLAAAQTRVVLAAGGHPVDLRGLMADDFRGADAAAMFAADRFHPSADGYRRTMGHVVPVVVDLLRGGPGEDEALARDAVTGG
ncbi:SGNH/GDSL hydrolase family protein [Jannaschia sp. R86511]|uniref:SGNH/GDSL hydrolase family protein n=1 Tax=Jannaschia sp. R86511 TaxID=3093853 RepID=UPI0036D3BE11